MKLAICLAGLAAIIIATKALFPLKPEPQDPPVPPPTVPEYTLADCVVEVAAEPSKRAGYGLLVEQNGQTFVVTSKMIAYDGGVLSITTATGEKYFATTIREDATTWLLALGVVTSDPLPAVKLSPATMKGELTVYGKSIHHAEVLRQVAEHWVTIGPGLPNCPGAPVVIDGKVAGLVIGLNKQNREEAIAVHYDALAAFVEVVQ